MDPSGLNNLSFLDSIKVSGGADRLRNHFHQLAEYGQENAIQLINDETLRLSSLFLLKPEIRALNLGYRLNSRNQKALEIMDTILSRNMPYTWRPSTSHQIMPYPLLKWMLETGYMDDGLCSEYDEILEITASLLSKLYKDKTVLPVIAQMLFNRYRKGFFTYHLIWAFFECRDPGSLMLLANGLRSSHPKDVELARKLLGFIPCMNMDDPAEPLEQYNGCVNWLQDNHPFLYYTGESLQETFKPEPYAVSNEAKYLCKPVSVDTGTIIEPLTDNQCRILDRFRSLDGNTRSLLSNCSFLLHQRNLYRWNAWLHSSISRQVMFANALVGGLS